MPIDILDEWKSLRGACEEAYYKAGYAGTQCRHTNNNNGSPSEPCNKGFPKKAEAVRQTEQTTEHLSPELILEACPTLSDYGQPVRDLADIVSAGRYLRASLGAHESAWAEARGGHRHRQGGHSGDLRPAALRGRRRQERRGEPDQEPGRLLPRARPAWSNPARSTSPSSSWR